MNAPSYFEIQASDPKRAVDFYRNVFGWNFELNPDVPIEYYRIETDGMMG